MATHAARLAGAGAVGAGAAGALGARARFAERLREEAAALGAALAGADGTLAAARARTAARRAALADAHGALRALERHRDGWRLERGRRLERAEEEALEDVISARRSGP
jgi:SWI/SNF-related matrix-associated actin-dependent regulator 1 of chromatin subfamily A